jgi:hypothetical protein
LELVHLRERFEQLADVRTDGEQAAVEFVDIAVDQLDVVTPEEEPAFLRLIHRVLFDVGRRRDVREVIARACADELTGGIFDLLGAEHALMEEDVLRDADGLDDLDLDVVPLRPAVDVLAYLADLETDRSAHRPAGVGRAVTRRGAARDNAERARAVGPVAPRCRDLDRRRLQLVQLIERLDQQTNVALDVGDRLV